MQLTPIGGERVLADLTTIVSDSLLLDSSLTASTVAEGTEVATALPEVVAVNYHLYPGGPVSILCSDTLTTCSESLACGETDTTPVYPSSTTYPGDYAFALTLTPITEV